jgi:hypothetical protein
MVRCGRCCAFGRRTSSLSSRSSRQVLEVLVPPLVPSCTIIVIFSRSLPCANVGSSTRTVLHNHRHLPLIRFLAPILLWDLDETATAPGSGAACQTKANLGIPPYEHRFVYGGFCGRVLLKLGYRHGQIVDRRPLCKMATSRTSQF